MHPCVAKTKDSYVYRNLCIKAKPWFVAYGYFIEDIGLSSHLSIKAKHFWPKGDRFRQVPFNSRGTVLILSLKK